MSTIDEFKAALESYETGKASGPCCNTCRLQSVLGAPEVQALALVLGNAYLLASADDAKTKSERMLYYAMNGFIGLYLVKYL